MRKLEMTKNSQICIFISEAVGLYVRTLSQFCDGCRLTTAQLLGCDFPSTEKFTTEAHLQGLRMLLVVNSHILLCMTGVE